MADTNGTMALLQEIQALTREGEQLSPVVRDRLILKTMEEVLRRMDNFDEKLEGIEKSSIGLWFSRNPKLGTIVISIGLLLLNLWFVSDFRKPVLAALGLPPDLFP